MSRLLAMIHRARGWWRRDAIEQEMNEELRAHLDGLTERNVSAGMSPKEARLAALRTFGGVEQIKERARDERRSPWGEQVLQDVRYALRQMRKNPGFTTVVVFSLALGIGANAFFFGLIDRVLLRTLPVENPEELVRFQFLADPQFGSVKDGFYDTQWRMDPAEGKLVGSIFSLATFERFRPRLDLFAQVFAFAPSGGLMIKFEGRGESALGQYVSGDYFQGFRLSAIRGRILLPDDDRPEAAPVAVISRHYWQRVFGGDPEIVGKRVWVNRLSVMIVGVVAGDGADPLEAGYVAREITLPLARMREVELKFGPRLGASSAWWLTSWQGCGRGWTLGRSSAAL